LFCVSLQKWRKLDRKTVSFWKYWKFTANIFILDWQLNNY
jgi:hypothetical protein